MFKQLISSISALLWLLLAGDLHAATHDHFKIARKDYGYSTEFEIDAHHNHATIKKSLFTVRTCYSLYDSSGEYQGYGACRLLCLGVFYNWATEIDIYDAKGRWIGLIDGQMGTTAAAKFSIYDASSKRVGIAYLDKEKTGFTIVDPENGELRIASYMRQFIPDAPDHWVVEIYRPDAIDSLIMRIFAAFAVDRQASFRADT